MTEPTTDVPTTDTPPIPERLWMLWDRDCGIWVEADEDICDGPICLVFFTEEDAIEAAAYLGFDCYPVQVKGSEAGR